MLDAQGTGDFISTFFRQVRIENQEIIDSQFRIFFSDLSTVYCFRIQVFYLKLLFDPTRERLVFRDDQNTHNYPCFANFYTRHRIIHSFSEYKLKKYFLSGVNLRIFFEFFINGLNETTLLCESGLLLP